MKLGPGRRPVNRRISRYFLYVLTSAWLGAAACGHVGIGFTKPACAWQARSLRATGPRAAIGCGYRPAYAGEAQVGLSVTIASTRAPRHDALQALAAGARSELAKAGALRAGASYPRLVVQLLRVDELSAGVAVAPADTPLARGSSVGVVGRGWIEESKGGQPTRDTGDVRRAAHFASGETAANDAARYDDAVREAARAVGETIARRVLGEPEPSIEPM
jgi:hypothetical protein